MIYSLILSLLFIPNSQITDSVVYIQSPGIVAYMGRTETATIKNAVTQIKKSGVRLSAGLIAVEQGNENWGFYSVEGKKLSDSIYTSFRVIENKGVAIKKGFGWGLMDFNGTMLVPCHYAEIRKSDGIVLVKAFSRIEIRDSHLQTERTLAMDNIIFLDNTYAAYEIAGKTGLMEYTTNTYITLPIYESIRKFNDSLFIVEQNKKKGLINKMAEIRIPVEYEEIIKDTLQDYIKVKSVKFVETAHGRQKREKYGIYSLRGRVIVPANYDEIGLYTNGMYAAANDGKWGYVNTTGEVAIPFIFGRAGTFVNGVAPVMRNAMYGIADLKGSWVAFPDYASIQIVNDSVWLWNKDGRMGFFDAARKQFLPETYQQIIPVELGNFVIRQNDKYGLLSPVRKLILKPEFTSVKIFENEKIIVAGKDQYYSIFYLNGNLKVFMNYPFSKFLPYKEGMAMVVQKEKYGFIDRDGLLLVSTQYDETRPFSSGMAAIRIANRWGFIDNRETILTMPYYDEVNDFIYGTAAVKKNGKYGFVNKAGKEVTRTQYDDIELRPTGNHVVKLNNRFGLVNQSGVESVNPIYKDCIELTGGVLKVRLHTKYGLIDTNNKQLAGQVYDDIRYSPVTGKFIFISRKDWEPVMELKK